MRRVSALRRRLDGRRQHRDPRQHDLGLLNPESGVSQDALNVSGREAHRGGIVEHAAQQIPSGKTGTVARVVNHEVVHEQ